MASLVSIALAPLSVIEWFRQWIMAGDEGNRPIGSDQSRLVVAVSCTRKALHLFDAGLEAPRSAGEENQFFIELGAWQYGDLQKRRIAKLRPCPLEGLVPKRHNRPVSKGDITERAKHFQAMIDAGIVGNRAELARHVGLSRARMTQIMKHLQS